MKQKFVSIILFLALINVNKASTVPIEKAKTVAANFLSSIQNNTASKKAFQELQLIYTGNLQAIRGMQAEPAYYIFTPTSGQGFVIIAGDDAVEPIIGYSLENNINVNEPPINFLSFMEGYKYEILSAKKNNTRASNDIKNKWEFSTYSSRAAVPVVEPLTKATWGQREPYNDKCPLKSEKRTLTGCVATAMGQIMHYWNYPAKGRGSRNGVNFGSTTYDWKNMPNWVVPNSPTTEKNAISTLLYHCGKSVDMDYGLDGSSAETEKALYAFKTYFGYDRGALAVNKYDYSTDSWKQLLKIQLDNGQPILYRGKAEKVFAGYYKQGHAWVCDGYDSYDYFHMNWGWSGQSNDGYYRITDLEPGEKEFQYKNLAVINITKPNRLNLSAISASVSNVCSMKYFYCSVTKPSTVTAVNWTVPAGWSVDRKVSTGLPITSGSSVVIDPPANFNAQKSITIRAIGITAYGEKTAPQYAVIGTGAPSFTKDPVPSEIGSAEHCFTPSPRSTMQILEAGIWKNLTDCITLYNGSKKTVTVRASNACGVSAAQTFNLTSPKKPNKPDWEINANEKERKELNLSLYPIPTSNDITIKADKQIQSLKCFNSFGQSVNISLSNNHVSVSHLSKGVYFLNITIEDGSIVNRKFIKE